MGTRYSASAKTLTSSSRSASRRKITSTTSFSMCQTLVARAGNDISVVYSIMSWAIISRAGRFHLVIGSVVSLYRTVCCAEFLDKSWLDCVCAMGLLQSKHKSLSSGGSLLQPDLVQRILLRQSRPCATVSHREDASMI